jgi:presenilin-like A22 family membrane protease
MFLVTQLIGLLVISIYNNGLNLPFGMEPPEDFKESSLASGLSSIISAFIIAILFFFLLMKINAHTFIRLWYFFVTVLALGLTIYSIIFILGFDTQLLSLIIAFPLAYIKIFKRNLIVHNITELLIYPGIAAVFISFLNNLFGSSVILSILIILLIISIYDIWAVWHSKIMQKMAEFQMNNLKFFTGFFVPYAGKKEKERIKLIKEKYAGRSDYEIEKEFRKAKIKVNLAILGGGDVIFPIITLGIFYQFYGIISSLLIILFSTIALSMLFILARKGKYYPAMPFISAGLYFGMAISWMVL